MKLKTAPPRLKRAPTPLAAVRAPMAVEQRRMRGRAWMALRERVIVQAAMTCAGCGVITPDLECDHITPLWRGGNDDRDNLQALCVACHAAKTAAEAAERANR